MTSLLPLHPVLPCNDGVQEDLGKWRSIHLAASAAAYLALGKEGRKRGRESRDGGRNKGKEGREIFS